MDWRSIAYIASGAAGFAAFVGLGAFSIASLAPGDTRIAAPNAPLLTATAPSPPPPLAFATPAGTAPAAPTLEVRPAAVRPPAEPPRPRTAAPPPPEPAPASTGALRLGPAEPAPAAAARLPKRGSEALMRQHVDEQPAPEPPPKRLQRPAQKPPAETFAALSPPPALPGAGEALAPPRPPPIVARPAPDRRYEGVLTPAEIARMRYALRLTPDQQPYWQPVEVILQEIGAQQIALVRAGRRPDEALSSGVTGRLYWAARPLLGRLREDQKVEVRKRARLMGFESVASMI